MIHSIELKIANRNYPHHDAGFISLHSLDTIRFSRMYIVAYFHPIEHTK